MSESLRIHLMVEGRPYGTRNWTCCPRVGETVVVKIKDGAAPKLVSRVVHLLPSRDAEHFGFQEIDVYLEDEK